MTSMPRLANKLEELTPQISDNIRDEILKQRPFHGKVVRGNAAV